MKTLRAAGMYGLCIVVAAVFIYAGLTKLRSPQAFADGIAAFRLLPAPLINPLALGLPIFEIATGLLLFGDRLRRTAAFGGLIATTVFLSALGLALARGLPVECGCFGGGPSSLSPAHRLWLDLGRDLLLFGALLTIYLDARRVQNSGRLPSSR